MAECKYFDNCPANTKVKGNLNKPMSIIKHYQENYCLENPAYCARRKVIGEVGKEALPSDLLPYQHEQAEQIINNNW